MQLISRSWGRALVYLLLVSAGPAFGTPTLLFQDNFDSGVWVSAWVSKHCRQAVIDGQLVEQDTDGWPRDALAVVHDADPGWTDYTVSLTAAFDVGTPSEVFAVMLRTDGYDRSTAGQSGSAYEISFSGAGGFQPGDGRNIQITRADYDASEWPVLYY